MVNFIYAIIGFELCEVFIMRRNIHASAASARPKYKRWHFFNWKKLLQFLMIIFLMMALFGVAISGAIQNLASALEEFLSAEPTVAASGFQTPATTSGLLQTSRILEYNGVRLRTDSGTYTHYAIDGEGEMWVWGYNNFGQTGLGYTGNILFPTKVTRPAGVNYWLDAVGSAHHALALAHDGSLWVCGSSQYGQLGLGSDTSHSTFQKMPFPSGVTSWREIYATYHTSFARDQAGNLWMWGRNLEGQVGDGTYVNKFSPVRLAMPSGVTQWVDFSPVYLSCFAVDQLGRLWSWGNGANGAHGSGSVANRPTPQLIPFPAGVTRWDTLRHTGLSTYGIDQNGNPWVWGRNAYGELGIGSTADQLVPIRTNYPSGVTHWKALDTGVWHFAGIDQNNQLWVWGNGLDGALGLGSNGAPPGQRPEMALSAIKHSNPPGTTGWQGLFVGAGNTYVVDSNGALWVWGYNPYGQLGKGVMTPVTTSGENTDNWVPWRWAASLVPTTANNWASPNDAVTPENTAIDVTEDFVTIRFDREMSTITLGTIAITCEAGIRIEADVVSGTWSSGSHPGQPLVVIPNSVFTAPIPMLKSNSLHVGEVFGFRDALFGIEMHPHGFDQNHEIPQYPYSSWYFTTGVLPQVVDSITPRGSSVPIQTTTQLQIQFREPVDLEAGGTVTIVNTTPNTLIPNPPYALNPASYQWSDGNRTLVIVIPTYFDLNPATRYDIAVSGFKNLDGGVIDTNDPRNSGWFITEPGEGDVVISKVLQMPEGTATPNTTFIFDVIPYGVITARDSESGDILTINTSRAGELPALNAAEIEFMESLQGTTLHGVKTVFGTTTNLISNINWTASGQFVWRLKERRDTYEGDSASDTMHFDPKEFELVVIVQSLPAPSTDYHIAAIELRAIDLNTGKVEDATKLGLDELNYTNTFIRQHIPANPKNNVGFKVTQAVLGDFADSELGFKLEVTVDAPKLITDNPSEPYGDDNILYRAYVLNSSGTNVTTDENSALVTGTDSHGAYIDFEPGVMQLLTLKPGEELVFTNMHVGSTFNVVAQRVPAYTHRATLTLANVAQSELTTAENSSLNIGGPHLVGEVANAADFVAYNRFILPTRLAVATPKMLSALIALAVAAILVVLSLRHRRKIERLPLI